MPGISQEALNNALSVKLVARGGWLMGFINNTKFQTKKYPLLHILLLIDILKQFYLKKNWVEKNHDKL